MSDTRLTLRLGATPPSGAEMGAMPAQAMLDAGPLWHMHGPSRCCHAARDWPRCPDLPREPQISLITVWSLGCSVSLGGPWEPWNLQFVGCCDLFFRCQRLGELLGSVSSLRSHHTGEARGSAGTGEVTDSAGSLCIAHHGRARASTRRSLGTVAARLAWAAVDNLTWYSTWCNSSTLSILGQHKRQPSPQKTPETGGMIVSSAW